MSASSMRKKSFARSSKPRVRMCVREQSLITMSSPQPCWPVPMRAIGAQNLLTMPGGVSSAGYLHKKGGSQFSLMKWPLRYIILHKGCLYYFKSSTSPAPQGAFSLNGYNRVMRAAEETTSSNVFPFKIVHFSKRHRTWFFSAASEDERRKWMRYLRREIDHYNDRKDSIMPSDIDSDMDSFYGTIERPMDITHLDSNADDDYIEEDDDEDEEDYLKPDDNCSLASTAGRPAGPPPAYPPPPVPASFQLRQDCVAGFYKAPPPPPPIPTHHRIPTSPLPPKPLPCLLPPPIPKGPCKGPPPPPPNPQRPQGRALFSGDAKRDWRPLSAIASQSPATLPICDQLETRLVLNGPEHCSLNPGGSQSLGNHHQLHSKPSQMTHHPANTGGSNVRPVTAESLHPSSCHPLLPGHPPPVVPKPPQPAPKSPLPAPKTKPPGGSLQRSSPEGQSFRSPGDEVPPEFRRKQGPTKRGGGDDSEKSMQLPDSVFINTTETSFVERLFREGPAPLEDGLYGIRKSGTKTSKVLVVWDVSIGKARNYRLFEDDDRVFLDSEVTFPTLSTLIEHYHSHPLPHHGSLCLQKPFT